jgi:two-component system phosphate regulon sensor histidine kinase PhoR
MVYSARTLALLLAVSIAIVTALFLSLLESVGRDALLVATLISFSSSYLLIFVILEFLVFREINKIYKMMEKLRKKELANISKEKSGALNPLQKINEEIYSFATLKQKEIDELKKLEVFRKEFIADVSHELKTPVFNIQGYVSTLIDGGLNDPSINLDYLKRADKSVERIIHIIDDLETISQLEVGTLELDPEVYDIAQQVRDIIDALEFQASKQNIKLQLPKKYDKPTLVKADKFRIRQVLVNLITNSIKYGKENGKTTISLNLFDEQVIVEVKDNGIGIDEKHLPRLFERFYRVDKGRSREQGGTGLGLAIVKHIIEGHGETIDVISKVNEGTTISFTLKRGN